jgi:DNA-binding transcriptional ArsR family regulator
MATASATQALVECVRHPVRARILTRLAEGRASPKQLAGEFETEINRLHYHVRKLEELGLIHLVDEQPSPGRRGPVQHFYEVQPLSLSDADWLSLPVVVRNALAEAVLRDLAHSGGGGKRTAQGPSSARRASRPQGR